jgi:glycosyltransferase involved in cell wall biosynthesis
MDRSDGQSRLRIVQVVCTDEFAGTERYVQLLSDSLSQSGHSLKVIGGDPRIVTDAMKMRGVNWQSGKGLAESAFGLMRTGPVDIIHAHMTSAETVSTLVGTMRRIPVVATRHFAARRGKTKGGALAAKFIAPRLSAQIAISDFVASRAEGKTIVIPNGVRDSPEGAHDEKVVLVAQRLESEKETSVALRAWKESGLGNEGWVLHVAGTGAETEALRHLARELGIEETCRFLGFCDDIGGQLSHARILLATAPAEPFGLSVVEAMATGLPVIAVGSGGTAETVGPVTDRWLFRPGDYQTAGKLLAELAADPSTALSYGRDLRATQKERFNIDVTTQKVEQVYHDVLGR